MFRSKSLLRCTQAVINNKLGNNASSTSLCKPVNNNERSERNRNLKCELKESKSITATKSEVIASESHGKNKSASNNFLATICNNINTTLSKHRLRSSSCSRLFEITKKTFGGNIYHQKSTSQNGIDILNNKQNEILHSDYFNRNSTNKVITNLQIIANSISNDQDNINNIELNKVDKESEQRCTKNNINTDSKDINQKFNSHRLTTFALATPRKLTSTITSNNTETVPQYQARSLFKDNADELDIFNKLASRDSSAYFGNNYFRQITNETEITYKDKTKKLNIKIKEKHSSFLKKNRNDIKIKNNPFKHTNCNYFKMTDLKCIHKVKYFNPRRKTTIKNNLFSSKNIQSNIHKVHQLKNTNDNSKQNTVSKYDSIANFEEIIDTNVSDKNYKIAFNYNKKREETDKDTSSNWRVHPTAPHVMDNNLISRKLSSTKRFLYQNFRTTAGNNLMNTLKVEKPEPIKQHKKEDSLQDDRGIYVISASQVHSEAKIALQKDATENSKKHESLHNDDINIQTSIPADKELNSILNNNNMYFNELTEGTQAPDGKPKSQLLANKPGQSTGPLIQKSRAEELDGKKLHTSNEKRSINSIYTLINEKISKEMLIDSNLEKEITKEDRVLRSIYNSKINLYEQKFNKIEDKKNQLLKINETHTKTSGKNQEKELGKAFKKIENCKSKPYSLLTDKENVTPLKENKSNHCTRKLNKTLPKTTKSEKNIKKKSEPVAWTVDKCYEQMKSRVSFKDNKEHKQREYILNDIEKKNFAVAWMKDLQITAKPHCIQNKESTGKNYCFNNTKEQIKAIPWIKEQQNHAKKTNSQTINKVDSNGSQLNRQDETIPSFCTENKDNTNKENSEKVNVLQRNSNSSSAIAWMRNKCYTPESNIFSYYQDKTPIGQNNKNYSKTAFKSKKQESLANSENIRENLKKYEEISDDYVCRKDENNSIKYTQKNELKLDSVKSNNTAEKRKINNNETKKTKLSTRNKIPEPATPWVRDQNIFNVNGENGRTSKNLKPGSPWIRGENIVKTNMNDSGMPKTLNTATPWLRGENIVKTNMNDSGTPKTLNTATPWLRGENIVKKNMNDGGTPKTLNTAMPWLRGEKIVGLQTHNNGTSKNLKAATPWRRENTMCVHVNASRPSKNCTAIPWVKDQSDSCITTNECRTSKNLNAATAWVRSLDTLKFCENESSVLKNDTNAVPVERGQSNFNINKNDFQTSKKTGTIFDESQIHTQNVTQIRGHRTIDDLLKSEDKYSKQNQQLARVEHERIFNTTKTTKYEAESDKKLSILWTKDEKIKQKESLNDRKLNKNVTGLEKRTEAGKLLENANIQLSEIPLNKSTNKMKEIKLFSAARMDSKSIKDDSKYINNNTEVIEIKNQLIQHKSSESLPLNESNKEANNNVTSERKQHSSNKNAVSNKNEDEKVTETYLKRETYTEKFSSNSKNLQTKSSSNLELSNVRKANDKKKFYSKNNSETSIEATNDKSNANCTTKKNNIVLNNRLKSFEPKESDAHSNFLIDKLMNKNEKVQIPLNNEARAGELFKSGTQNIPDSLFHKEMESIVNQNTHADAEKVQLREEKDNVTKTVNKNKLKLEEQKIELKKDIVNVDVNKMKSNNENNNKIDSPRDVLQNTQKVKQNYKTKNKLNPQQSKIINLINENDTGKKYTNNTEEMILNNLHKNENANTTLILKQSSTLQEEEIPTINNNKDKLTDNKKLRNIQAKISENEPTQHKTLQCDLNVNCDKKTKSKQDVYPKIDSDKNQIKEYRNQKPDEKLIKVTVEPTQEKTSKVKLQESINNQIINESNCLLNNDIFKINTKYNEQTDIKEGTLNKTGQRKELMKVDSFTESKVKDVKCTNKKVQTQLDEPVIEDRNHAERIAEFYNFEDKLLGFTSPTHDNAAANTIRGALTVDSNSFQTQNVFDPILTHPVSKYTGIKRSELQPTNNSLDERIENRACVINDFTKIETADELIKLQNNNHISNKIDSKESETFKAFQNKMKFPNRNYLSNQNLKSSPQLTITVEQDSSITEVIDIAVKNNKSTNKEINFNSGFKENEVQYKTGSQNETLSRTYYIFNQSPEEMIKITGKCEETSDFNTSETDKTVAAGDEKFKPVSSFKEIPTNDFKKSNVLTQNQRDPSNPKLASQINKNKVKNENSNLKTNVHNEVAQAKKQESDEKHIKLDKSKIQENEPATIKSRNTRQNSRKEITEHKEEAQQTNCNRKIENLTEDLSSSLNINMLKEIFDYELNELTGDVTIKNKGKEEKDNTKTESDFNSDSTEILQNEHVTICIPHRKLSAKSILVNNKESTEKTSEEKVTPILKTMLNAVIYTIFKNENSYNRLTKFPSTSTETNIKNSEDVQENKHVEEKKETNIAAQALKNETNPNWKKRPFIMPINDQRFPMINNQKLKLKYPKLQEFNVITTNDQMVYKHVPSVSKVLNETIPESTQVDLQKWERNQLTSLGETQFEQFYREQLKNDTQFHDCIRRHILGTPLNVLKENACSRVAGSLNSLKAILSQLTYITVLESPVVHPELPYHGIVDCIGCYNNEPVLIEWKQADNRKSVLERTYDAPLQLSAYIGALNYDQNYKLPIKKGIIVMAYTDGSPADVLPLSYEDCLKYWKLWLERLKRYLVLKA